MKGGKAKSDAKYSDNKLSVKKTGKAAAKDPNKPKRAPSAFFVFMEGFRQKYKEEHPNNKSVANVGKAAGQKWKSMSEADKAPYVETAEKRKKEYEKSMIAYEKKLAGEEDDAADDESDKSKSEVHDDDEEGSDEEDEDDD